MRAVIGAAVYLALAGLFAMGLGAIVRNTAAGIAAFAAIMFVLPPLISIFPLSISGSISPYLPSNAGGAVMQIGDHASTLSAGAGLAVFAGYVTVVIAPAAVLLIARDV